jgi:hypothetical protein
MSPAGLAAPARFRAGQIVDAGAGMRVDHAEGGVLCAQMLQDQAQHRVLEDVGKAAGMKGVTVVQSRPRMASGE